MNRKFCCRVVALLSLIVLTGCSSSGNRNQSLPSDNLPPVASIAATSGTPQSHAINSAFGQPLVATVTTNGNPASGLTVTFIAPLTGASGTFSDTGSTTANAITDSNGVATSPAIVANGLVGTYTITATMSGVPTPASFSLTNTTGAPAAITATSGGGQSAAINTGFQAPLVATVMDSGQNPASGAVVTFTAPTASGGTPVASGTFASGAVTEMDTTNASGMATSTAFTANGIAGAGYTVTATVAGVTAAANFSLTNAAGGAASITANSGSPQFTSISTAFAAPLVALVVDASSNPVSGAAVTFTAPASGASGTFANGTATETDTTNASGLATSTTFTANATTGSYTVAAAVPGVTATASFSLTNQVQSSTYVFYLSGEESSASSGNFYALAGAVQIDTSGGVIGGVQDYNDGQGLTSPQPSGDAITGGTLTANSISGQYTLTLITNNTSLGVSGTETLGVQFVNSNHALIMQFDSSATSSGSMDLQKLPTSPLSGGYAFTIYGVDAGYAPIAYGGVFTIAGGTTLDNGFLDTDDNGTVTQDVPLTGTLTAPGAFGRGTLISDDIAANSEAITFNYYVIGAEAMRIIDVDPSVSGSSSDTAVGSAFGQGVNATGASNASIGNSAFAVEGSVFSLPYAFIGMLSPSSGTFSGVADDNELTNGVAPQAAAISGSYSIASNGYGSLTITAGDLGNVSLLGVYMTDPNLNLTDPNNTTSGIGGALIADMDPLLAGGTGILVPQTDTAITSFAGAYALGAQDIDFGIYEFDFLGQATVTSSKNAVLTGTGLLNDPFSDLNPPPGATYSGVTFSGTARPDSKNLGRYTLYTTGKKPNPFVITLPPSSPFDFNVAIYQASGGLLFWLDEDNSGEQMFFGSLQQQGSLAGLPAARKAGTKGASTDKP